MNCCSDNHQYYNEPLFNCCENCIFCLGKSNNQHIFLTYNECAFKINNKLYYANCRCRPCCHVSCMKSWLIESGRCPECSVYFTEIVEKKCCTFDNLCGCFLIFICISTFSLAVLCIIVQNKYIF